MDNYIFFEVAGGQSRDFVVGLWLLSWNLVVDGRNRTPKHDNPCKIYGRGAVFYNSYRPVLIANSSGAIRLHVMAL